MFLFLLCFCFFSHTLPIAGRHSIQFMYQAANGLSLAYVSSRVPCTDGYTHFLFSITRSGGIIAIGIGNPLPSSIDAVVGDIYLDLEIICRCVTHRVKSVTYEAFFMFAFVFVFRA